MPGRSSRRSSRISPHRAVGRITATLLLCAALFLSGFYAGLSRRRPVGAGQPEYTAVFSAPGPGAAGPAVAPSVKETPGPPGTAAGPGNAPAATPAQETAAAPSAEEILATIKWPVQGRIERDPGWIFSLAMNEWVYLPGVDIRALPGSPVVASFAGKVADKRTDPVLGNVLVLQHEGGLETTYGRLSAALRDVGEDVAQGDAIGSAGPDALYFKVAVGGESALAQEYLAKAR